MFFTLEKLEHHMRELEAYRYIDLQNLMPMQAFADTLDEDTVHRQIPDELNTSTRLAQLGDDFSGRDKYLWLQKQLTLPSARPGCRLTAMIDFGRTGHGTNDGFEALLYLNSHPYQGVDSNHQDVDLEDFAGQNATLTFLLWTGLEGGGEHQVQHHKLKRAEIGYLHLDTDAFYYYAKAIVKTLRLLPEESTDRVALMSALDRAFLRIDWDEGRFYPAVSQALTQLKAELAGMPKTSPVTIHCVGHTHIDLGWLWRTKHTREKAQRSFASALRLMDEFDDYRFLQTQPQLYAWIKQDCPELFEKIKQRVSDGHWEPDGGLFVEADCNIISGESLSRQMQHGIRFMKQEFDKTCSYVWLPDVFGYSWALPQLMQQCHLNTFMTIKISWNQYDTMPNDLFTWRGIDGSEVLTYFITTPEFMDDPDCRGYTYNGFVSPRTVLGSWKNFRNKDLTNDLLLAYGYGDGGGGVNRNMLKMRRVLDELPGVPHVKTSTAGAYFQKLHADVEQSDRYLPTWDGELYLEFHRATYTTQAAIKKANRQLEYHLAQSEWLSALAAAVNADDALYPTDTLYACWDKLLLNQFHDIIPGSSIHEVYDDAQKDYAALQETLDVLDSKALSALTAPGKDCYTVCNPGSFTQSGLVCIDEQRTGRFEDEAGNPLSAQHTSQGYLVQMAAKGHTLNGMRFVPAAAQAAQNEQDEQHEQPEQNAPASPFAICVNDGTLTTPYYAICWGEDGRLTRIFDRENDREVLSGPGNDLVVYEDQPMNFEAWNTDLYYIQKKERVELKSVALTENGAVRAVLRFTWRYRKSTLTQDMIVYAHSRRIDFVTTADWHESHRLLKAEFGVQIRSTKATYDIQYGHVERPTHYNTSWDWARFEVVGHKWADLSDGGYGVSLLNNCKYGYGIHDNKMTLSLLKSAKYPDPRADMGLHTFTYALLPHKGALAQGNTIEESVLLNQPLFAVAGACADPRRLIAYDGNAVQIDAVKRCEDESCLMVRLHECRGCQSKITLCSDLPVDQWTHSNPLEETVGEMHTGDILLSLRPFELQTLKIWFF